MPSDLDTSPQYTLYVMASGPVLVMGLLNPPQATIATRDTVQNMNGLLIIHKRFAEGRPHLPPNIFEFQFS